MIDGDVEAPAAPGAVAGDEQTPEQVVAAALRGELRLSLSLAGVLAHSGDPVSGADAVIDDLGVITVAALVAAGHSVRK